MTAISPALFYYRGEQDMAHDIELINKVRELAHEGLSTNNIGKVLNLTKEQVKHIFKKNNISNGLRCIGALAN